MTKTPSQLPNLTSHRASLCWEIMSCVQVFGSVYLAKYVKCWQAEQQVSYILVKSLRTMEISQIDRRSRPVNCHSFGCGRGHNNQFRRMSRDTTMITKVTVWQVTVAHWTVMWTLILPNVKTHKSDQWTVLGAGDMESWNATRNSVSVQCTSI